jgi:hypothetical protein
LLAPRWRRPKRRRSPRKHIPPVHPPTHQFMLRRSPGFRNGPQSRETHAPPTSHIRDVKSLSHSANLSTGRHGRALGSLENTNSRWVLHSTPPAQERKPLSLSKTDIVYGAGVVACSIIALESYRTPVRPVKKES